MTRTDRHADRQTYMYADRNKVSQKCVWQDEVPLSYQYS